MWTTLVVFTNKHKLKRELGKPVSWQPRDYDFALKIELTWRHNNPTDPLISLLFFFFLPVLSEPPALRVFAPHESMQRGILSRKKYRERCCLLFIVVDNIDVNSHLYLHEDFVTEGNFSLEMPAT